MSGSRSAIWLMVFGLLSAMPVLPRLAHAQAVSGDSLWTVLGPMQERRRKYEENPRLAWDILEEGSRKARGVAEATMVEARDAANLSHEYEPPSP